MGDPIREKSKHGAAFELYYALGVDRNFSEVARRLNVSIQAVSTWSRAFKWQERIAAREKVVSDLVAQKAVEDEAQSRADALKITRAIQVRFAQALNGGAQMTASDFDKAVRLEQLLRGKATDRSELMIGGPAFDALIDRLASLIELHVKDPDQRRALAEGIQKAASEMGHA